LAHAQALRAPNGLPGELTTISVDSLPTAERAVIPAGASVYRHYNGHTVVLTPADPILLPQFRAGGAYRVRPDDILALNPLIQAWLAVPVAQAALITAPLVEFRQTHSFAAIWQTP
jgi:hypothetical protein